MIRIGLVGAGRIGQIHGRNAAAHPGARLVAVADAIAEAAASLAKATGAVARSVDEVIAAKDIDAVMICTSTDTHADLIERAAKAGKAIFCEKPVDLSAKRIARTLSKVEAAGVKLMIGFNRRFDPNFAALRKRLTAGAIGEVEIVTILSRDPSPPPVDYVKRSGGLFRDMMIHDLDMARFLLGEDPVELQAFGSSLVDKAIGEAGDVDTAVVQMRTRSGKLCQISNSRRATYGYDQRIEVHGSKGLLRAGNIHETTIEQAGHKGFVTDPIQNFFLERYAAAYRHELDAFLAIVKSARAPSPSGHDGLKAQLLADAATLSSQSGKAVRVKLD
ncbi:myo-inositol 2-dehydrogenase [Rhizobiales bacterium GAS113]|nr:myo-inositol 2-dehydrogenase [Rhizobiales bacterium GAS113]